MNSADSDGLRLVMQDLARLATLVQPPPFSVRRALGSHFEISTDRFAEEGELVHGAKCTVFGFRGRYWTATTGGTPPRDRRWNWAVVRYSAAADYGWAIWRNVLVERPF